MANTEYPYREDEEIDDSLYSRQRYVLGDAAMKKLSKADIFISGLGGVGIEIVKNIVLAGVGSITIQDTKQCTLEDVSLQFFLREEDVKNKTKRANASVNRLAELNPYVKIEVSEFDLESSNLSYLKKFQCVVLTECSLEVQLKVDKFCREQSPQIMFIAVDVHGLFSSLFCDFGDNFEVTDVDGLEPVEFFIGDITRSNPAVITVLDYERHNVETGDTIRFAEVNGMTELNGRCFTVECINQSQLSINCDTTSYNAYAHSGIARQMKTSTFFEFHSLKSQLSNPDILLADYVKFDSTLLNFICVLALQYFRTKMNRHPKPDSEADFQELLNIAYTVNDQTESKLETFDKDTLRSLLKTAQGSFAPLCAAVGGMAAQEVLKSVTGKFSPIRQWLLLDAEDLTCDTIMDTSKTSRFHHLTSCIGEDLANRLANLRLFMVGCGAIGCEMLKNFALLGIGTGKNGKIIVTDNDLIEKSNLNRQFLFRPHHIQKSKSMTAAAVAKEINPDLNIVAKQDKVCPDTENIYSDNFFESLDIVVNALDNLEARRYVDRRCVTNLRPLIESGTLGPKGHVQVIVPHMTESYSSLSDPEDESIPYCTLKSFPQSIDHTIQWARDKFDSAFTHKPSMFNKFWDNHGSFEELNKKLDNGMVVPNEFVQSMSLLRSRPQDWEDCLKIARIRFEKYFNHKAKQLLHVFPIGTKLSDGTLFWRSPKRPPRPIEFDVTNKMHYDFVKNGARLIAKIYGMKTTNEENDYDWITNIIRAVKVPDFLPSSKRIVTDPDEEKPKDEETQDVGKIEDYRKFLKHLCNNHSESGAHFKMIPEEFEKDDDSNGHIDFITAASNLRADMYHIEPADRYRTKRIAGKIIPAISTTTATIAGLATIELVKVVGKYSIDELRNAFVNLAVPMVVLSIPGNASVTEIKEGLTFTEWDKWEVHGNETFTLQDFINHFQKKYDLSVSMVTEGVKAVYIPILPGHDKKLNKPLVDLVTTTATAKYVDLTVGFEGDDDDYEELPSPPVRYYF